MITKARDVYLGRSDEGLLVFASVRTEAGTTDEVTFTDHSTGPRPAEVAIMFGLFEDVPATRGRRMEVMPDSRHSRGGQVPPEGRVISDASDDVRTVERMWQDWHLNLMNAECDHMTPEILNPADEVLDAYIAEREAADTLTSIRPTFYGRRDALQKWRLDTVSCPETGYRYGRAWLARGIPKDDLLQLIAAVARLPRTAGR